MDDIKRLFLLCTLGLLIVGCSSNPTVNADETLNQGANIKLAESATTISNSLSSSAAIQRATTSPLSMKQLPDPNSYNMDTLASVDWSGPIGPIVEKIAQASNYQLRVLGQPPAIPALVAINEQNTPLGYILRDLDYQAGSKANIVVYPDRRVIELRYARS